MAIVPISAFANQTQVSFEASNTLEALRALGSLAAFWAKHGAMNRKSGEEDSCNDEVAGEKPSDMKLEEVSPSRFVGREKASLTKW